MKDSYTRDDEYFPVDSQITNKDVEEKLLHHFYYLKDEPNLKIFFGEYDDKDKDRILDIWNKIIKYLYEEIFSRMALTIKDIKYFMIIKEKKPLCIDIILKELIKSQKYITLETLKDDKYYEENYPELYPKQEVQKSFLSNWFSIPQFCRREEENDENKNKNKKNNLSEKEIIPEDSILFNYEILKQYCDALLMILDEILDDNGQKVIKMDDYKKIIKRDYSPEGKSRKRRFKLRYGSHYLDVAIYYLEKTKQIISFKDSNQLFVFIKKAKDKDDFVCEEDIKEADNLVKEKI